MYQSLLINSYCRRTNAAPELSLPAPGRCRGGSLRSGAGGVWGLGTGRAAGRGQGWGDAGAWWWLPHGQGGWGRAKCWPLGVAAVWPRTLVGRFFLGTLGLAGALGHLGGCGTPPGRTLSFLRGSLKLCSTPRTGTPIPEGSLGSVGLPELWQPQSGGQGLSGHSGALTPQIRRHNF